MAAVKTEVGVKEAFVEQVQLFRLRPGKTHWHGDFPVVAGDELYLNALQAHAFRDKFEPVDPRGKFEDKIEPNEPFMVKARKRQADETKVTEEVVDTTPVATATSEVIPALEKK